MGDLYGVKQWMLDFLTSAYISKKLYEKYCYEVDKKYGLTINDGEILQQIHVEGGESTARDIVEQKWVSKSQVSKSVEKLAGMGYITTETDESDRRFVRLRLTAAADKVVRELSAAAEEYLKKLFGGMNEEEIAELNRLLNKVSNNVKGGSDR